MKFEPLKAVVTLPFDVPQMAEIRISKLISTLSNVSRARKQIIFHLFSGRSTDFSRYTCEWLTNQSAGWSQGGMKGQMVRQHCIASEKELKPHLIHWI